MIAGWSLFFNDLTEQLPLVVDGIKETCKLRFDCFHRGVL